MALDFDFSFHNNKATIKFTGNLYQDTVSSNWYKITDLLSQYKPTKIELQLHQVHDYNLNGLSILVKLLKDYPDQVTISQASHKLQQDLALFTYKPLEYNAAYNKHPYQLDYKSISWSDFFKIFHYQLDIFHVMLKTLPRFKRLHWEQLLYFFETAGIQALPIIILLGLLLGVILTLQSVIALQQFGAEIFSINLVGLAVSQELAPLLTATLMSSRSGAAFAAELSSMRHNQEIDALVTMNISPEQLLVIPRILAILLLTPFMILFMLCAGVLGSAILLFSFGYSFELYQQYLFQALHFNDILLGFSKGFIFGFLIASISCFYGLHPATQIGQAATYSVVSSLIMIIIADSLIGVLIYFL